MNRYPKCGATVTDQTPSVFYVAHDERCDGQLEEPEQRCPYCDERARMSVEYNVEVGPCPLHAPESDGSEAGRA